MSNPKILATTTVGAARVDEFLSRFGDVVFFVVVETRKGTETIGQTADRAEAFRIAELVGEAGRLYCGTGRPLRVHPRPVSRQVALATAGGPDWTAFARGEERGCDECGATGRCHAACSFSAGAR